MTWDNTWNDILDGGHKRWKDVDPNGIKVALGHIQKHLSSAEEKGDDLDDMKVLCPLAGDDPFVHYAWTNGFDVTAIDIVPAALSSLRRQFSSDDSDWTKTTVLDEKTNETSTTVWKHISGRVTLYEGDIFSLRPELHHVFDVVYDKDSFGALTKDLRSRYCQTIADYTKDGAVLYMEVKKKDVGHPGLHHGPPFSVDKADLMEADNFGKKGGSLFRHVESLGEVYDINTPKMMQTGHILRRTAE
uniref:Thiopurine S-methyltransferase n=1 Tax=Helicotheca tamesis TaxID=374047 RepID=A0A7S2MIQ3_9STRA|eukprot:CAMPEP_0185737806 /NCGR_PEP_ID=MMETSP1171-20130828/31311_1 /TAXON_ID=374046 /ORGANISM="Helicotheca tamensis, Strain CCMP826" /LENGTH=244 /DNA_ID=CAMNT_0028408815 /DNA_START=28 /DNA_END=762 /DNA_ORIENTATION=+